MRTLELFCSEKFSKKCFSRPLIIAEAGVNHEGRLDLAKRLINEAAEGGADAIKFQTYRANTIASKDSPFYWDLTKEPTRSQFELFQKYDKFWKKEFEELKTHCDKAGIEFLSTPFDVESSVFLNELMDVFKISSSDITNKPFIKHLCSFRKPIILSTGASYLWEVQEAVSWIEEEENPLALLHCVLNYPTMNENAGLGKIDALKRAFPEKIIGYSDHTLPEDMQNLEIAALLGAKIIEKHFTYDKTLPGNDHYHAMDMRDLKRFHQRMSYLEKVVGSIDFGYLPSEEKARANARRSLVAARMIPAGKKLEPADLTFKRPASGVSPRNYDEVVAKTAAVDIQEDTVIKWEMLHD